MIRPRISLIITCDTRPPMDAEVFTVGDDGGQGNLCGCRSWDFLTEGIRQKAYFLRGFDIEVFVCVDVHEPIPESVLEYLRGIPVLMPHVTALTVVQKTQDKSASRWYDRIQLDAMRHGTAEYLVKFDQDANAMTFFPCDLIDNFRRELDVKACTFVCQPSDMHLDQHGMWWASTRFFMCRRDSIDYEALAKAIDNPMSIFEKYAWNHPSRHLPCLEHILGVMGSIDGGNGVFYPPRQDNRWLAWSWVSYRKGLLKALNDMPYERAIEYVTKKCIFGGPNDVYPQAMP